VPEKPWTVEFGDSGEINSALSSHTIYALPSHTINAVAQTDAKCVELNSNCASVYVVKRAKWFLRFTFLDEPPLSILSGKRVDWFERMQDFRKLCRGINLEPIARFDDCVTEVFLSAPWADIVEERQPVSLKTLPSEVSEYAAFRTVHLMCHTARYDGYVRYPPVPPKDCSSPPSILPNPPSLCAIPIQIRKLARGLSLSGHNYIRKVFIVDDDFEPVTLPDDPRSGDRSGSRSPCTGQSPRDDLADPLLYLLKSVDKVKYVPGYDEVLTQEELNLQKFHNCKHIVRRTRTVVSPDPYLTWSTKEVFRGILIEYHPNRTLQDALQIRHYYDTDGTMAADGASRRLPADDDAKLQALCLKWLLQVSRAVEHMHTWEVAHMDLAPKHVVFTKEWDAVVVDVSGIGGTTAEYLLPRLVGVEDWRSAPFGVRRASDIWALGKIAGEMAEWLGFCASGEVGLAFERIASDVKERRGEPSARDIITELEHLEGAMKPIWDHMMEQELERKYHIQVWPLVVGAVS
jgi:hypothetical protein